MAKIRANVAPSGTPAARRAPNPASPSYVAPLSEVPPPVERVARVDANAVRSPPNPVLRSRFRSSVGPVNRLTGSPSRDSPALPDRGVLTVLIRRPLLPPRVLSLPGCGHVFLTHQIASLLQVPKSSFLALPHSFYSDPRCSSERLLRSLAPPFYISYSSLSLSRAIKDGQRWWRIELGDFK